MRPVDQPSSTKLNLQYWDSGNDSLRVITYGGRSADVTTLKTFEDIAVNRQYLRSKTDELFACLRRVARAPLGRSPRNSDLDHTRELGFDLFRELVPASFRAKLAAAAGGHLLLSIDRSLSWIPWELLFDGEEFLCRRVSMGRILLLPSSVGAVEKQTIRLPLRHFSISDPEGNLPAAADEGRSILELLLELGDRARPVLLSRRVGPIGFIDSLKRADVLHFAGHLDGFDDEAAVRLFEGTCTARQIEKWNGRFSFPALVFLNGCRSSSLDEPLGLEKGQGRAFGLASALLICGVRHFVGTIWEIKDQVASRAGVSFFRALYSGESVGRALRRARESLAAEFGEEAMGWGGYVLYGDPASKVSCLASSWDLLQDDRIALDERCSSFKQNLRSSQPKERFLAAVGLVKLGDRGGLDQLKREIVVLFELLESDDLASRQQGEAVVRVICPFNTTYNANLERPARQRATAAIKAWWKSGNAEDDLDQLACGF